MSVVAPKTFQSSDTGAPTLSGTVGDLVEVMSSCLILRKMFTGISGGSFVDNTTEARLQGGTAYKVFQGPTATNDEAYFGLCQKFERILFNFGTAGVQNAAVTLSWQYWNGSAWTALTVVDGTSGLTVNGAVTFSMPSDWATTAVNSTTCYWVRLRFTAGTWTTNPLVNYNTLTGWSVAYTGTNQRAYQMGGGNQFFLNVNDNGPGAGTATEARVVGYETMSAIGTGTNPFPTAAQFANGLFVRKSAAANGTTRSWIMVCDDRTLYFYCAQGDAGGYYSGLGFGDFYSFVASDPYRTFIAARTLENTAVLGTANFSTDGSVKQGVQISSSGSASFFTLVPGQYAVRNYLSAVGAVNMGTFAAIPSIFVDSGGASSGQASVHPYTGALQYPNPTDGGICVGPVWFFETGPNHRGRLRGFWGWAHSAAAVADRTTLSGSGAMAGKAFIQINPTQRSSNSGSAPSGALVLETSDTWETNS